MGNRDLHHVKLTHESEEQTRIGRSNSLADRGVLLTSPSNGRASMWARPLAIPLLSACLLVEGGSLEILPKARNAFNVGSN